MILMFVISGSVILLALFAWAGMKAFDRDEAESKSKLSKVAYQRWLENHPD